MYRHATVEIKQYLLVKILKLDVLVENVPFPLDIDLFNEESLCVLSLLCQFLGLDSDRFVLEVLLRLLSRLSLHQLKSDPSQYFCLKFDEFLAESIHLQLVNFHMTRHFRYHSYLVRMFLFFNE